MAKNRKSPFIERRGGKIRVRYPASDGSLLSAEFDDNRRPFKDKAAALKYGWDQLNQMDRDEWIDPRKSAMTLQEWIPEWWDIAGIELLVEGTRRAYRTDIELHILPAFGKYSLVELADADAKVARWVTKQHADYAHSTADNRTALFSSILHEAVIRHRMRRNPLARSRRRGRKTSRAMHAREKVWATPLQVLLIAERAALLARGDTTTFIMLITKAYTGMRGREIVGLERRHVHRVGQGARWQLDVEWQLKEYPGRLARELPKDESRRPNDLPPFLVDLLHIEMSGHDGVCGCTDHDGGPYVFRGTGRSPHITSSTLDYRFRAAACGLYHSQSNKKDLPVSVTTDAFPGLPTHGHGRADACWVPILPGATPHSLRHSQRTWMDDDQIPESLKHQRLGHSVPGMSGAYGHVSADARQALCEAPTHRWEHSLKQRAALDPRSPLPLLDDILYPFRE